MANLISPTFQPIDVVGNFRQGQQYGRERNLQVQADRDRAQLRNLAPGVVAGDAAAFDQAAAIDPKAAAAYQDAGDAQVRRTQGAIDFMDRALATKNPAAIEAAYQQTRPFLSRFGQEPPATWAEAEPKFQQAKLQLAAAQSGQLNGAPAGYQEFKLMSAGLTPEDRIKAQRINLGLDPRQSSAAITYQKFKGADGVERLVAVDPRNVGVQVVGDGSGYGSLSPGQAAPANHAQAFTQLASEFPGATMTSGTRSAERNSQVGGQPNSQHLAGTAADYAVPANQKPAFISRARQLGYSAIDEGDHIHLQLPRGNSIQTTQGVSAPLAALTGRRAEDEAGAVEAARLAAQNANFGNELSQAQALQGVQTNAALDRAAGESGIKAQAERNAVSATRARDAQAATELIGTALQILPNATGSRLGALVDSAAAAVGRSTEGAKANAQLKTIAGQLTSKMPRMEGPQSDKDVQMYREMAGDLANENLPVETRQAAAQTIMGLQQKYLPQNQSAAPARVNSAADYNALPSGATYIDPQGNQRRKR